MRYLGFMLVVNNKTINIDEMEYHVCKCGYHVCSVVKWNIMVVIV